MRHSKPAPRIANSKAFPSKNLENAATHLILIDSCITFRDGLNLNLRNHADLIIDFLGCSAADIYHAQNISPTAVVLIDVDLPDQTGIEVCQWLIERYPDMPVLLLCDQDWDVYLVAAWTIRAAGVLSRKRSPELLAQAIRCAAGGPVYTEEQMSRIESWRVTIGEPLKSLRLREWNVLWQIASGLSNRETAEKLGLSKGTVEKYVSQMLEKFNLASRSALLVFIYSHHLDVFTHTPENARKLLIG
jgi:DNA-binding NarL/FixJ family response regulator